MSQYVDPKIWEFFERLNEDPRCRVASAEVVRTDDGREEYVFTGTTDGINISQCFIWKNPYNTYGWSRNAPRARFKEEIFMGDIKHDSDN